MTTSRPKATKSARDRPEWGKAKAQDLYQNLSQANGWPLRYGVIGLNNVL